MDLVYFVLAAYGLTQIIVYGSLFDGIRPQCGWWGKLFRCSMCAGFWTGAFLFGINEYTELFTFENTIANFFILGWLSSGTSYILSEFFGDCGLKLHINHRKGEEEQNEN